MTSMLANGYDADTYGGLDRYQFMWAITSINADAETGFGLGSLNMSRPRINLDFG